MTGFDKTMMVPGWNISWLMFVDLDNTMQQ
jgi:hypothetical protein